MQKLLLSLYYVRDIALNLLSRDPVVLISEPVQWSIYEDCKNIQEHLHSVVPVRIAYTPIGLRNKIVHFASVNTFIRSSGFRAVSATNTVILTWFHLVEGDPRTKYIRLLNEKVSLVHTSSHITKQQLIGHGLAEEKIVVIPLGVDTDVFHPAAATERQSLRKQYAIPPDVFAIGSFQKDGNGWGAGLTPKLVKGPDIFCDVLERIAIQQPIHVLLTGPSRGYVRKRLDAARIPYSHVLADTREAVAACYRMLDLYLIASRAEGGPKALLEAAASGIAVVSTAVGMVPDIMHDGSDCMVAPVEDVPLLTEKALSLIANPSQRSSIATTARSTAERYALRDTVRQYYDQIYQRFL